MWNLNYFTKINCFYYNKKDKVNPFKHPDLYEYVLEFKRKKDIEDKSNLNHKINHIIIAMSNHKKQIEDAKEKIRKKVKIFLEKNNCSLLLMVQQCNINYPHVYEFVHYGRLGNISLNNAEKLNDFVNKYEEKYNQEF